MRADKTVRIFGPEADPTATEILPLRLPSGKCIAPPLGEP